MLHFLRPIRFLAETLTAECSARQLALGFAMGAVIGLVPKGNLTGIALMVILCGARVNLGAGLTGAFLFSWLGAAADPLTHRLGELLLTAEVLSPLWIYLYDLPVVPWTAFNNTVVLGSFVLGLMLFFPTYWFGRPVFEKCVTPICTRLQRWKIVRLVWGAQPAQTLGRA